MKSVRSWWVGVALFLAGLLVAPGSGHAESGWLNLHFEGGPGVFLAEPQSERFGVGGGGSLRVEYSPLPFLGIQVAASYFHFPVREEYDFEGRGLERPDSGFALFGSGGVRFRLLNDQSGYALAWRRGPDWQHSGNIHGNLWVDIGAAYVYTGGLHRVGLDVGIGYEMSLIDGLQIGPFVRYLHVFQPNDEFDDADAMTIVAGLSISVAIPSGAQTQRIPDTDGDGLLDPDDECPEEPEDFDNFEDEDGCPELDNDGDGILDEDDQCPLDPEDIDEFEDEDGCPDVDNDEDGILDVDDACPIDREDQDGIEDEDGCPEDDADGDGILDEDDQCPLQAEVVNGVDDTDGCPDEADIEVVDENILLRERIHFAFEMARIRSRSRPIVDQIAQLLIAHPEYASVAIEGHCDDMGPDHINDRLSQRRADRVRTYLIRQGVEEGRLQAIGYGRRRPLNQGQSDEARRQNRRVEFRIVQVDLAIQEGRARPRQGREVAPDLGPGGVVTPIDDAPPADEAAPPQEPDSAPPTPPSLPPPGVVEQPEVRHQDQDDAGPEHPGDTPPEEGPSPGDTPPEQGPSQDDAAQPDEVGDVVEEEQS